MATTATTGTRYVNPRNPNEVINSTMTHLEAAGWLDKVFDRNGFARDLAGRIRGNRPLSPAQVFWVHKLANEQMEHEAKVETAKITPPPAPRVWCNLSELVKFMTPASDSLKSGASLTFRSVMPGMGLSNEGTFQIKRARANSRYPGQYFVTDGLGFPQAQLYGRILTNGDFVPHKPTDPECPVGLLALLDELQNDVRRFIQSYGVRTGRCCFCDSGLTDDVSYKLGYGPVCAKHYKMPHSAKAVLAVEAGKPLGEIKEAPKGSLFASDLQMIDTSGRRIWAEGWAHKGLWYNRGEATRDAEGEIQYVTYVTPDGKNSLKIFND